MSNLPNFRSSLWQKYKGNRILSVALERGSRRISFIKIPKMYTSINFVTTPSSKLVNSDLDDFLIWYIISVHLGIVSLLFSSFLNTRQPDVFSSEEAPFFSNCNTAQQRKE
jgi:hypothetical protein